MSNAAKAERLAAPVTPLDKRIDELLACIIGAIPYDHLTFEAFRQLGREEPEDIERAAQAS